MEERRRNIVITQEQINCKVIELGEKLSIDYENKDLYVLCLLRGSFIFTADLVRQIQVPVKLGFITTSSYGNAEETSGLVKIVNDVSDTIKGMDVLIVDDIIDSGLTMKFVMEHVIKLGAASVRSCVLLDKPERRKVPIEPDYFCFEIPDIFLIGYGLNYGDHYRNIPYVFNWENND